jgi:hypothetical protein
MRSDPTLRKWFRVLNRKWFDNKLPNETKIFYSEELIAEGERKPRHDYGDADWEAGGPPVIRINPLLREQGWYTAIRQTLIHEAAHIEAMRLGYRGEHGPVWEKIMRKLANQGAFSHKNGISLFPLW